MNAPNYEAILKRAFPHYRWLRDPRTPNRFQCGDETRYFAVEFLPRPDESTKGGTKILIADMKLSGNPFIAEYSDGREDLDAVLTTAARQIAAWGWTPGDGASLAASAPASEAVKGLAEKFPGRKASKRPGR